MSVVNFIQTIWSEKIQRDLEESCKLVKDCTRKYEGDCEYAKTVKILGVGDPTVAPYVGQDIDIEDMTDTGQDLVIDVQNYFAFKVKDVDKAQSVPGLPEEYQRKAKNKLVLKREKFIGALVAGKAQATVDEYAKNTTYKEGAVNIVVATNKTKAAIKIAIDEAITILKENNFEDAGVVEIGPRDYRLFKDELVELKTNNDELISRGVVGKYDNYDVKETNNIYKDEDYAYAIVRSRDAIAFAGQINEVEALRMERNFSDLIRGLDTFGAKIIAQEQVVCVKIPLRATA
ncbi:MAG: hypothetical protein IJA54_07970 [Tyzzerella sp.]|nr:hypothetical protein [Tyzzerella sp.]